MARVMRRALADAGITPADVDHVNANGLGTQEADLWEAAGIREVFGTSTPVWGLKGYLARRARRGAWSNWSAACWPCKQGKCRRRSTATAPIRRVASMCITKACGRSPSRMS